MSDLDIKRLPDAELTVMQAIWECDIPATRADIESILEKSHPMAVTTLLTLLSRLSERGFISVEKAGRAGVYSPKVTKREYLAAQSRSFVKRLCGGSMSAFANALCDSGLTKEELRELRELLDRGEL